MEWTRDLWNISYPSLTTLTPLKSQKILFNDGAFVQIYSNQKEIYYISPSIIRASVETRASKLHYLLKFSPSLHPRHFMNLLQSPTPPPPHHPQSLRYRIAGKCSSTLAWMGWMHEKNTFLRIKECGFAYLFFSSHVRLLLEVGTLSIKCSETLHFSKERRGAYFFSI